MSALVRARLTFHWSTGHLNVNINDIEEIRTFSVRKSFSKELNGNGQVFVHYCCCRVLVDVVHSSLVDVSFCVNQIS